MRDYSDADCLEMSPNSWQKRVENGFFSSYDETTVTSSMEEGIAFIRLAEAVQPYEVQPHAIAMLLNIRQESDGISRDQAFCSGQEWFVRKDWFESWLENLVLRHRESSTQSVEAVSISASVEESKETEINPSEEQVCNTGQSSTVADRLEAIDRKLDEMVNGTDLDDFNPPIPSSPRIESNDFPRAMRSGSQLENPPGDYFKIELCSTFSPFNRKVPQSYVTNTQMLAEKRWNNVRTGKSINAGMPETKEELDLFKERFRNGDSIAELADYFQRSHTSIEIRLERLGLLDDNPPIHQERPAPIALNDNLETGLFRFISILRTTLNSNLNGLETSLSALNENVDIDESIEEAPLCTSVEKLLMRVGSEMDVLRDQLRSTSDPNAVKRLIPGIIDELDDLQSDLEIIKPRVVQVLDIQKESMLVLADILSSIRGLLDGLPEDALIQHMDRKEKSKMLKVFATSGNFFDKNEN